MSDREDYMRHLLDEVHSSIERSEKSEETYRARVDRHIAEGREAGRNVAASEVRASTDSVVRGAASDGAFYRDRAQTYSLAFLAEVFSVEIEDPT